MSTPADRIRRALGFCHRRFWSQKVKDAIKDAASALAELELDASKWERLHDELYGEIASEHRRDEYGETETAAECIRRVLRERDELRAKLDEYERAPTVAYVVMDRWKVCNNPEDCFSRDVELIARPRKNAEQRQQKCPKCGAPESNSNSSRTTYECGSSDYDQRPGTFKHVCGGQHG